ncbi:MAG TPA: hypothetical protein VEC56_07990, partial [Candidatus Krumholzibacteria bacterium]|nr:hypothetical protein [Candidatus Krumholzibacteria bacterium]
RSEGSPRCSGRRVRWAIAIGLATCAAASLHAAPPMRATKEASVVSTAHARYAILQGDQEIGTESVTRRVFDNNTIRFDAENLITNPGVAMTTRSELVIEEESYFPRSYRADKTVRQSDDEFVHALTVDMVANVAVLGSELRGAKNSRRVVVPAGTAIQEVGTVHPWYQLLFWVDPASEGRQRIQWLDPASGVLDAGELYVAGQETIAVLGKKTRVTVYKAERERLGEATLYVDAKKRIVRAEQNMLIYRLDQWSEELAKK